MTGARFRSPSRLAMRRRQGGGGGHGNDGHGRDGRGGGGDGGGDDSGGAGRGHGHGGGFGGGFGDGGDGGGDSTTTSTTAVAEEKTTLAHPVTPETTETKTPVVVKPTTEAKTTEAASKSDEPTSAASTQAVAAATTSAHEQPTSTAAGPATTGESSTTKSSDDAQATAPSSSLTDMAGATSTTGPQPYPQETASGTASSSPTAATTSGTATLASSTSSASSSSGSRAGVIAGVVVALVALGIIGFLLYRFRRTALVRRALAPFRRGREEPAATAGPYYHFEKPGGGAGAARNMTGETLVGVPTARARGPGSRASSWAPEDSTRYLGPNPALAVKTGGGGLAPRGGGGVGVGAGWVSPVGSQTSQDDLGSDVSPVSPSFNHSGTLPIREPSPVTSRPGRGTAVSIAGSEARIVRIPPRSSRLAGGGGGGGRPGSGAGTWRSGSQRTSSGSTELSPPPLVVNRNRRRPPVSMRSVPAPATTAASAPDGNGGYQAYHPSMSMSMGSSSLHHPQGGLGRRSHESRGSLSGVSVASSDVFSPDSITWPMPPGTPTTPTTTTTTRASPHRN